MDNLLYLPFDTDAEDASIHALSPSTETGGIIYPAHVTPVVGAGAGQLAEATTNLVGNPSLEINATGFVAGGLLDTVERVTTDAFVGIACVHLYEANAGGGGNEYMTYTVEGLAAATDYAFQVAVKKTDYPSAQTGQLRAWWYTAANAYIGSTTLKAFTPGDHDWTVFTAIATSPALTAKVKIVITMELNAAQSGHIYADAFQVEQKAYPTPYCDGSLGTGHSWSGAAHASTSIREVTALDYALTAGDAFSIEGWFSPATLETEFSSDAYLLDWYNSANDRIALRYDAAADDLDFDLIIDGVSKTVTYSTALVRNTPIHISMNWDGTTQSLDVNGVSVGTPQAHAGVWGTAPSTLYVGSDNAGANHANIWLDELIIFDVGLTEVQAAAFYAMGLAGGTFVWQTGPVCIGLEAVRPEVKFQKAGPSIEFAGVRPEVDFTIGECS